MAFPGGWARAIVVCLGGLWLSAGNGCLRSDEGNPSRSGAATPLVLSAGVETIDPAPDDTISSSVDLSRLGIVGVSAVYDLTTPADEPLEFSIISQSPGNSGAVRVSLAHALDGGATPTRGVESVSIAGIIPSGTGFASRGTWLDVNGDGFARLTLQGAVSQEQVFAVGASTAAGDEYALVRIRIGPLSAVNVVRQTAGDYPGVVESVTLYSSDSWMFGLPTVAVSGDRTSIVTYEGDRSDPQLSTRYEMRLQYDSASGQVTGGGSQEPSLDSGNWRDHEIAALYNVLGVVAGGTDSVTVKLSFDRGATFGQVETVSSGTMYTSRLVQIAMALDYTLAVVFWRDDADSSDLILLEGRPSAFGAAGSPTAFSFDAPKVLAAYSPRVSPVIMGVQYSDGGDLVVGYGYTQTTRQPDGRWSQLTQYRCIVRPYGSGYYEDETWDTLVEEDLITGYDPSVSLLGQGNGLTIFFAYEAVGGIRLRVSTDAGRTFSAPIDAGDPFAQMPAVFARIQNGQTRVDLLYLQPGGNGSELLLRHWDDFGTTPGTDHRLTRAVRVPSASLPPGTVSPGTSGMVAPDYGTRITQVAWFGYDATLDGDDVVLAYDEVTYDAYWVCTLMVGSPIVGAPAAGFGGGGSFTPADPPPLAPGLTEPVPPPDPDHMHQLRFLRLD